MDVRGHLDLLLLTVLADAGPVHGYALIATLRERSGGAFDLPEGTVYPALHRLERDGLVVSHWEHAVPRRRRVYSLTPDGRRARVTKQAEWHTFLTGVESVLAGTAAR
ncbi:PadR family transcriptional regulator [Dactylosporangium sp. NPDC050588]|uniref:PadR family transcriptional regulator n=1 Tax=Dactylosporangium sp. NPDC050588 TaxID=3157211 RepID=UPI0033C7E4CA